MVCCDALRYTALNGIESSCGIVLLCYVMLCYIMLCYFTDVMLSCVALFCVMLLMMLCFIGLF